MKIDFNNIPKFLVNLDRRPDRLSSVTEEFEYMGWTFERFNAIDTGSYEGCGLWNRALGPSEIQSLYSPYPRWKTRFQQGRFKVLPPPPRLFTDASFEKN